MIKYFNIDLTSLTALICYMVVGIYLLKIVFIKIK